MTKVQNKEQKKEQNKEQNIEQNIEQKTVQNRKGNTTAYLAKQILEWHKDHRRELPWRKDQDPYHVWVSEIMLQQTRIEAVIPYYERFLKELPEISDLAQCPDEKLMKLWEGLGYYSRVRNLKKAAKQIMDEYGGKFPEEPKDILGLAGIGAYTAGAVGSICFGNQTPAVDGNVLRIWMRYFAEDSCIDDARVKKEVTEKLALVYKKDTAKALTEGLMELGQTVCIPNGRAKCEDCPLQKKCRGCIEKNWDLFPVRAAKKARKVEKKIVYVLITDDQRIIVEKRGDTGLLAGMWQFPNVKLEKLDAEKQDQVFLKCGINLREIFAKIPYKHIFSHVEWDMESHYYKIDLDEEKLAKNSNYLAVSMAKLKEEYAIPSAFQPFLKNAEKLLGDE